MCKGNDLIEKTALRFTFIITQYIKFTFSLYDRYDYKQKYKQQTPKTFITTCITCILCYYYLETQVVTSLRHTQYCNLVEMS